MMTEVVVGDSLPFKKNNAIISFFGICRLSSGRRNWTLVERAEKADIHACRSPRDKMISFPFHHLHQDQQQCCQSTARPSPPQISPSHPSVHFGLVTWQSAAAMANEGTANAK